MYEKASVHQFFRDVTGKPFHSDRSATRMLNILMAENDYLDVEIPINRLNATQDEVNADYLDAAKKRMGDGRDLPAVVKYQGSYYVADGHHRLMAAATSGAVQARVRLFDLDCDTQLDFPLLDVLDQDVDKEMVQDPW